MVELAMDTLHVSVSDPVSASMNFLNEVAGRFPDAISLAAGRPNEGFHDVDDIGRYLNSYVAHLADQGMSPARIRTLLTQYGRTNGQIHGLVARLLETDEGIRVPAEAVAVTAGCQEAMLIVLRGLCATPRDVLLTSSPCYVGITGAARVLGVGVRSVPEERDGIDPAAVARAARAARADGLRPRALYVLPNFANPSGVSLDVPARRALLEVAAAEDLLLIEDDPYGLFGLDDSPRPSLKALDTDQRVIYLGSFAKSCFPGARVGFLVADQTVVDNTGHRLLLAEALSTVKSMVTVNTSPVAQAVIGGMLVSCGYSLRAANQEKIRFYRRNMKTLIDALERHFSPLAGVNPAIRWNVPDGGFFAVLDVPMIADEKLLEISARQYGVLWTPMSFFYTDGGGSRAIRLSCSYVGPDEVTEGVRRLARLVEECA
ncbi:MAG TPA: PLP-dependent aminotransferase family protein [Pilimelia sp.]|nr:PLP-dependent aminotransferase family protein [Pilimelia sp.]